MKQLKLFELSDIGNKSTDKDQVKLSITRNRAVNKLEETASRNKEDRFGNRPRIECTNCNYACVSTCHDLINSFPLHRSTYLFSNKANIVPSTTVEYTADSIFHTRTFETITVDELFSLARTSEHYPILFRRSSVNSLVTCNRTISFADLLAYWFIKKQNLSFTFLAAYIDDAILDPSKFKLWCECHNGLINKKCVIYDHTELDRRVLSRTDKCCLICNAFMYETQQMKQLTDFNGHFSTCEYFINI